MFSRSLWIAFLTLALSSFTAQGVPTPQQNRQSCNTVPAKTVVQTVTVTARATTATSKPGNNANTNTNIGNTNNAGNGNAVGNNNNNNGGNNNTNAGNNNGNTNTGNTANGGKNNTGNNANAGNNANGGKNNTGNNANAGNNANTGNNANGGKNNTGNNANTGNNTNTGKNNTGNTNGGKTNTGTGAVGNAGNSTNTGANTGANAGNSTNTGANTGANAGNSTNTANNNADPQKSLTLDPKVIATGFANDGQDVPAAGQVKSLTSTNNFINFCLTVPNLPITNGKQITTGSCNPAPIGVIPSVDNMPSSKFTFPANFGTVKENTAFTISMAIQNMQTGFFVNAQENYFAAPQTLNAQGQIQGHSHVVVEQLSAIDQTTPTDPRKFAFFKGLNAAAAGGKLTADVTSGLPAGFYKLSSINSASNHQPVIVPIAQHGSLDDAIYFTVTADGNPAAGAGAGALNPAGGSLTEATSSAAAAAATVANVSGTKLASVVLPGKATPTAKAPASSAAAPAKATPSAAAPAKGGATAVAGTPVAGTKAGTGANAGTQAGAVGNGNANANTNGNGRGGNANANNANNNNGNGRGGQN